MIFDNLLFMFSANIIFKKVTNSLLKHENNLYKHTCYK